MEVLSLLFISISIIALVSLVLVSASGVKVYRIRVEYVLITARLRSGYRGGLVLYILSRGAGIR